MLEEIVANFYLFLEGFCFRDLSTFPFLIGRSASWRDSVSVRLVSPVLERRRGSLHPRKFHGVLLLVCAGPQVCENVGFLVCSEAGVPARWIGNIQNRFAAIYLNFSTCCSTIGEFRASLAGPAINSGYKEFNFHCFANCVFVLQDCSWMSMSEHQHESDKTIGVLVGFRINC